MTDREWEMEPGPGEGPPPPDPNQGNLLPPDAGMAPGARAEEDLGQGQGAGAPAAEADEGDESFSAGWAAARGEDTLPFAEPIAPRVYYSIGEVCDLTGLKPHVLRYWETQFEVMNPTKNRAGNRVYRPKDIDLIFLVKKLLYEQKYTIEGARQRLLEMRRDGALDEEKHEVLGPEFLAEMKRELVLLKDTLTLPPPE